MIKKYKSINEVRHEIDKIDDQLVDLISIRKDLVVEAVKHKTRDQIIDRERIEFIIRKLKRKSKSSSVSPELLEKIWRVMINSFIEFEEKNFDKIHRI